MLCDRSFDFFLIKIFTKIERKSLLNLYGIYFDLLVETDWSQNERRIERKMWFWYEELYDLILWKSDSSDYHKSLENSDISHWKYGHEVFWQSTRTPQLVQLSFQAFFTISPNIRKAVIFFLLFNESFVKIPSLNRLLLKKNSTKITSNKFDQFSSLILMPWKAEGLNWCYFKFFFFFSLKGCIYENRSIIQTNKTKKMYWTEHIIYPRWHINT